MRLKMVRLDGTHLQNSFKNVEYKSLKITLYNQHCEKCSRVSRRPNGRVADISSKPAYSKRYRQPDRLGQAVFYCLGWRHQTE
jgi:hypothetical protein